MDEEIFNLKLKCHKYEERLAYIGLGGITGGKINWFNNINARNIARE